MTVLVVGSINVDLHITVAALPLRGETVLAREIARLPGGKGANQAVAAARAGAQVAMIGGVGPDDDGELALESLRAAGVDTAGVWMHAGAPTGLAVVTVGADGENTVVVVPGANALVDTSDLEVAPGSVVLLQLELPMPSVVTAVRAARLAGALVVLNAAPALPVPADVLADVDVLVVNETEAASLPADPGVRSGTVTTLGARGCRVSAATGTHEVPGHDVPVVDTTGAGDCFVGTLAAELARGTDLVAAATRANAAAAESVQRRGAR